MFALDPNTLQSAVNLFTFFFVDDGEYRIKKTIATIFPETATDFDADLGDDVESPGFIIFSPFMIEIRSGDLRGCTPRRAALKSLRMDAENNEWCLPTPADVLLGQTHLHIIDSEYENNPPYNDATLQVYRSILRMGHPTIDLNCIQVCSRTTPFNKTARQDGVSVQADAFPGNWINDTICVYNSTILSHAMAQELVEDVVDNPPPVVLADLRSLD